MRNPLDVWAGLGTIGKLIVLILIVVTLPISLPVLIILVYLLERES